MSDLPQTPPTPLSPSIRPRAFRPAGRGINYRLLLLLGIVLVLVGFPLWWFMRASLTPTIDRGSYTEVDLKWLSDFEMDQVRSTDEDVPNSRRSLDGKRVELTGEIYATRSASDKLEEFDLVYSISKCCFTGTPKVQHFIRSKTQPGHGVQRHFGLVKVIGRLHVGVEKSDTRVLSVYRLDVEQVKPLG